MKNSCFLMRLGFLFQFISVTTNASHSSSGDLSYRCLGSTFYEVTYTFYSKCGGNPTNDQCVLTSTNNCGFGSYTYILPRINYTGEEYSTTCQGNPTICNSGLYYGYRKNIFMDTINLYYQCAWTLGITSYSRPIEITTIISPDTLSIFAYCMIDNTGGLCNNSPRFINPPSFVYCTNQTLNIDNSVIDDENDSVTYSLVVPKTGPQNSDTVIYYSGYSYRHPFQSSIPMAFDTITGSLIGTPILNDVTVYAVLVNEYRNGILIGQVMRDAMFFVENCSNVFPTLSGINGIPGSDLTVFTNQPNYFKIYSTDGNVNDQTFIEYDSSIIGMSFFFSRGYRDTAFFSWTPTPGDTSSNPHSFTLRVKDSYCPYCGTHFKKYNLFVENVVQVEELNPEDIMIWPIPVKSEINFAQKNGYALSGNFEISICDIQGRKLRELSLSDKNTAQLNDLGKGIYLVYLKSKKNGAEFHKRIIKQ